MKKWVEFLNHFLYPRKNEAILQVYVYLHVLMTKTKLLLVLLLLVIANYIALVKFLLVLATTAITCRIMHASA
jgi:hypothetical protein